MAIGTGLIIRPARLGDNDQIGCVYESSIIELCAKDYSADIIKAWAKSSPADTRLKAIEAGNIWVAEWNGMIAGYVAAVAGEVLALFIGGQYAGHGIGKALAYKGIELAKAGGASDIILESTITAAPFYEKLGFVETGRGYFSHGTSDIKIEIVKMVLAG